MKKTVKWLTSALIFLLVGVFLLSHIAQILRKKAETGNMIQPFYELEKDSLDILVIGSSHAYSSFQPNYLWKEYGLTSWVLGSQRQTAITSYYLLLDALNYQKPSVVVLETYYFFYSGVYTDEGALRYALDSMPFSQTKVQAIEDILEDLSWREKLSWYLPFVKYHSRWKELKDYDFGVKTYLKGGIQDYTVLENQEPELTDEKTSVPTRSYEYLEKIIDLCEENGIELVLYAAPFGYGKDSERESFVRKTGILRTLRDDMEERGIPFIWYQDGNPAGIDWSTDFRDRAHLNTYGIKKVTEHLGAYLTENYDLPDHRGDEAYSSWDEDYAKYMEREAELTGDEG